MFTRPVRTAIQSSTALLNISSFSFFFFSALPTALLTVQLHVVTVNAASLTESILSPGWTVTLLINTGFLCCLFCFPSFFAHFAGFSAGGHHKLLVFGVGTVIFICPVSTILMIISTRTILPLLFTFRNIAVLPTWVHPVTIVAPRSLRLLIWIPTIVLVQSFVLVPPGFEGVLVWALPVPPLAL